MLDPEFLKTIAPLGVGGGLAALIFMFYRSDMTRATEMWKGQSDALLQVVKENTASNIRLVSVIDALNQRLERGTRT